MLDSIVRHLHQSNVPFRLASYPSPEREPHPGHPLPPRSVLLDVHVVSVDGRLVLACVRDGDVLDLAAIGNELGGAAVEAPPDALPVALVPYADTLPPLGNLLRMPLVVDDVVESCVMVVFRGFSYTDYFEVPFDDFAVLEQPRIASFARAGELEEARPMRNGPRPGASKP
jgi:hypothetical protein